MSGYPTLGRESRIPDPINNRDIPVYNVSRLSTGDISFDTDDHACCIIFSKGWFRNSLVLHQGHVPKTVLYQGGRQEMQSLNNQLFERLYKRMRDREEQERISEQKEREQIEAAEAEEATSLGAEKKGLVLASVVIFGVMLTGGIFSVIDMNSKMGAPLLSGAQAVSEQPSEVRESAASAPDAKSPGIRALSSQDVPDDLVKSYLTDLEENDPAPRYEEPVPDVEASAANASEDETETSQAVALSPRAGANDAAPEAASGRDLLSRFYGNAGGSSSLTERKANLKRIWDERKDENGISDIPGPDTFTAIKGTAKVPTPGGGNLDSLSQITDFGLEAE